MRTASRQPEPIVIVDLVLAGLAITLEPLPLTAFLLVLASDRGTRKGAAFVFGWLLSLAAVIALTVLATGNKPPKPRTPPPAAVLAVKIAIGAGLLVIALRQRRRMSRPTKPGRPRNGKRASTRCRRGTPPSSPRSSSHGPSLQPPPSS